jgi:uncharacterized damage-inducible protein DinB
MLLTSETSTMLTQILRSAFTDDLRALRVEIEAYPAETDLWKRVGTIRNSAGNLALHQTGAIRYLIGAVLGGIDYERDRKGEFARTDVPRAEILAEIDAAIEAARQTLERLTEADLDREYPIDVGAPGPITTGTFMVRLAMHTSYHNGQINYHRRILAASNPAATQA